VDSKTLRQGFFAGLIVAFVGLPIAIVADGREMARELGALAQAAQGNTVQFKAIWMPQLAPQGAVQSDAIEDIQRWGAWNLAHTPAPAAADVSLPRFMRVADRSPVLRHTLVLAGFEVGDLGRGLESLGAAAFAAAVAVEGKSGADANVVAFAYVAGRAERSRFTGFVAPSSTVVVRTVAVDSLRKPPAGLAGRIQTAGIVPDDQPTQPANVTAAPSDIAVVAEAEGITVPGGSPSASGFVEVAQVPGNGFAAAIPIASTAGGLVEIGAGSP